MRRLHDPRLVLATVCILSTAGFAQATFSTLGDLPNGFETASSWGISRDGSSIVGAMEHNDGHFEAFRWTEQSGVVALGLLNGRSWGSAINGDGSVVVGRGSGPDGFATTMRWTEAGGIEDLGIPDGFIWSEANAISADGGVIAGYLWDVLENRSEAYRWTTAGGFESIGELPGGSHSASATGLSDDSETIVGWSGSSLGQEAFRWTRDMGMVGLGMLPDGTQSIAQAISGDGQVVVGNSVVAGEDIAFRWTESDGMVSLGVLPGMDSSRAFATDLDGSMIVGVSESDTERRAFMWTEARGMRDIQLVMEQDFGLDLGGLELEWVTGVSGDGLTLTGRAFGPQGRESWIAVLPTPSSVSLLMLGSLGFLSHRRRA